jgi:DNA-binding HxlR family transcriptional regulator
MEEVRREKAAEILIALLSKPRGVRELWQAVGGSPNTVELRVRELQRAGLIQEGESETWPYRKVLSLTDRGRRVAEMLRLQTSLAGPLKKPTEGELRERGKWLLSLLHVLGGSLEGAVRLQKLVFLMKRELGMGVPYQHVPFQHGPFCGEIYEDLMDLESAGWVNVVREVAEPVLVSLTEEGKRVAEEVFRTFPKETREGWERLKEFNRMPLSQLLEYVYTRYPKESRMLG